MMVCKCIGINKKYGEKQILKDFDLELKKGKITCASGASGTGKTTLLNIVGCIEKRDSGRLILFDQEVNINLKNTRKLLRDKIGYLFQDFGLMENKTVMFNLKLAIEGHKISDAKNAIKQALKTVGLENFENKLVQECSGGEKQRVAVARLLIKPCELVLADEPTGSLDDENKMVIFKLLQEMSNNGKTILLVTHDEEIKLLCDEIIHL